MKSIKRGPHTKEELRNILADHLGEIKSLRLEVQEVEQEIKMVNTRMLGLEITLEITQEYLEAIVSKAVFD